MRTFAYSMVAATALVLMGALPAAAGCVTKAAIATSGSEDSAKWYAKETMVQSVSWSLWPAYLSDGSVPGYTVKNERYKCTKDGGSVTCHGQATFCKIGG
ncbi:MAG: hypothetical protein R3D57_16445 [Hyphomicrobiaceae bacterium]